MATKLLIIGDVHLGRQPHRMAAAGLDPRRLSPVVAWRRAVDQAIKRDVAAVVLAGDLVDEERDRFEAYGYLERGVRRLLERDISVLAVAGNHDGLVLPRLADRISGFQLLGPAGTWELFGLDAATPVDLLGWSFPGAHHRQSPLEAGGLELSLERRRAGVACLGLLHADLDAAVSPYAPVSRAELEALGLDGWFLGHIHRPDNLAQTRPLGYLGSLVGLDRGETSLRGPWQVTVHGPGRLECAQIQLGPLRWEDVEVDVSGIPEDDGAPDALHAAVERAYRRLKASDPSFADSSLAAVGCSVDLVGRTWATRRLRAYLDDHERQDLCFDLDGQRWATVNIRNACRPAVNLESLAGQHTPAGLLARLLLDLEEGAEEASELLDAAGRGLEPFSAGRWSPDNERWPLGQPRRTLLAAGYRALDALLEQGGAG